MIGSPKFEIGHVTDIAYFMDGLSFPDWDVIYSSCTPNMKFLC